MKKRKISVSSKIISVLSVLSFALCLLSIKLGSELKASRQLSEINSLKVLGEFCESLDSITTSLQKSICSGTAEMLEENSKELFRQSSIAKVSLAALTDSPADAEEIYKFLSQVGDYTLYLSAALDNDGTVKKEDSESLDQLLAYSESLSRAFEEITADYNNGGVTFSQLISIISDESDYDKISFSQSFSDSQQTFSDYPTLLYDGPFSDTSLNRKSQFLPEKEVTADEAAQTAADLLGEDPSALKKEADVDSEIEMFCFSKNDMSIGITKRGGYVCYLMNPVFAGEATISAEEAIKRGLSYLSEIGYTEKMKESYYSVYDGICTVNYAYAQDDTVCYADLIKVSISLETGKIVSLDARGYLMNHRIRQLPENIISAEEAVKSLSPRLTVLSQKKAVIPLENGSEAFCLEFRCKTHLGSEVLVYTDCLTGEEKEILLLLYSDNGVLTK